MKYPSASGLDITGKSVSIVYLERGEEADSAFTYHVADGFAKKLEEDYFGSEPEVKLFKQKKGFGNYADKDTLVNLVMDTNNDVVFIIDAPTFTSITEDDTKGSYRVPFTLGVYVYDSMNSADSVYKYIGKSAFTAGKVGDVKSVWKESKEPAYMAGYSAASKFSPTWKEETYAIVYFDSDGWVDPVTDVMDFNWQEAMNKWLKLAKSGSPVKRSSACFNIATCCFMLQQYDLALEWLDQSDADYPLSVSSGLRKSILQRKAL